MAFERKDNTASLFKNDDKSKETDRDYQGEALVNGVPMWVSGYINQTKAGKKYLNLTFKPKDEARVPGSGATRIDLDDAIPFAPEWR